MTRAKIDAMNAKASFLAGFCTGLRSATPLAVAAWKFHSRAATTEPVPASSHRLQWTLTAMAAGELVADKLPFTPSRTERRAVAVRLFLGALVGAYIAPRRGKLLGALSGAAGSLAGTFGGHAVRVALPKALDKPDFVVALLEDVVTITGSLLVVNAASRQAQRAEVDLQS